ncbi:MAG: TVP38/TMEM64 family protein [Rhodospirillaceae bacterium]|nr:TVP38/TMEM64 family protein [Rhodospirillaceae bacterium]
MTPSSVPQTMRNRILVLAAFVVALVGVYASGVGESLTFEGLRQNHDSLKGVVAEHYIIAVWAFMAVYFVATSLSIPGAVWLSIAGGLMFGTIVATATIVLAATAGACVVFLLARYVLGDVLRTKAGSAIARMETGFQRDALSYMLVLRLVPLFPFFLVNLVPAFLGVPLRIFALGTLIGIIPGAFVFASVGAGLGDAIAANSGADPSKVLMQPTVIGALIGLAALSLIPVIYRRWKARTGE